jgi:hypothetical protein
MIRIIIILIALVALALVLYLLFSKNQKPWEEMTEKEKNKKKVLVASGIAVFLSGLIASILLGKKK